MTLSRRFLGAVALALLPGVASAAYPERPINMVIPFAAGGPTDAVARLVAEAMGRDLGQSIVIENVGGAGGTLGANRVAQARPDGYNVLLHHIGQATSATLYRKLPYDTLTGFEPVGLITEVPMTLVSSPQFPATTLADAIRVIRERKDAINLGNAGIGAASHLCGMMLMSALDTRMTTVPFRGTGPAMTELLSGRIDLMCDQTTNTTENIRANRIKVFAVTTSQRVASLPDVPTTAEAGLPALNVSVWHGIYTPKGTPAAINERLSQALQVALKDEKVVSRFADLGTAPVPAERATPAYHKQFLAAEVAKWRPIIQAANEFAD